MTFQIISGILVALLLISAYIIRNLLIKLEKYEDITQDQVQYLQNISNAVGEGSRHLQNLDAQGTFQSDDDIGFFFKQMQEVQEELNRYMLPDNYGQEKS